jgi:hypothetical protein
VLVLSTCGGGVNAHPPADELGAENRVDRNSVDQRNRTGEIEDLPAPRAGEVGEAGVDCGHGGLPFSCCPVGNGIRFDLGVYAGRVRKGLIRK